MLTWTTGSIDSLEPDFPGSLSLFCFQGAAQEKLQNDVAFGALKVSSLKIESGVFLREK
jgi:hypothetical protein